MGLWVRVSLCLPNLGRSKTIQIIFTLLPLFSVKNIDKGRIQGKKIK